MLENIYLVNQIDTTGDYAFINCKSVSNITHPSTLTNISLGVFSCCSGLTSMTISSNVLTVGWGIFNNCTNLKQIYCEAQSLPSGWDTTWNEGSTAEIIWGYKPTF